MTDLNLVLGTRPNDADALSLRGIAYTSMKQYDKALDDLGKAIAQTPTVERYFARATIYEAQGNVDKATSDYRSATQLNPANVFDYRGPGPVQAEDPAALEAHPVRQFRARRKDDTCL